jgi:hypothetical protein
VANAKGKGGEMKLKLMSDERMKFRAECREVADALVKIFIERIDQMPEEQQLPTVSMLITEMQVLVKKVQ